jgi:hypothetical protein
MASSCLTRTARAQSTGARTVRRQREIRPPPIFAAAGRPKMRGARSGMERGSHLHREIVILAFQDILEGRRHAGYGARLARCKVSRARIFFRIFARGFYVIRFFLFLVVLPTCPDFLKCRPHSLKVRKAKGPQLQVLAGTRMGLVQPSPTMTNLADFNEFYEKAVTLYRSDPSRVSCCESHRCMSSSSCPALTSSKSSCPHARRYDV